MSSLILKREMKPGTNVLSMEPCTKPVDPSDTDLASRDSLRVNLSDPNPHNRRARWIKHRNRTTNDKTRADPFAKSDSGFQEHQETVPQYHRASYGTPSTWKKKPNGVSLE